MYPVINLLRELHKKGELAPAAEALLAPRMADEELYDLTNDPYEINNLANSERIDDQRVLQHLRGVLQDWIEESNDHGRNLEPPELVQQYIKVMYDRWGQPPSELKPPFVYQPPYVSSKDANQ